MKKIILTLAAVAVAAMFSSCTCCNKTEEAPAGEAVNCECCESECCKDKCCKEGCCEEGACEKCECCTECQCENAAETPAE